MSHANYMKSIKPEDGWIVDVGANDGLSNTWSLPFEEAGFNVFCIEGNPHHTEALPKNRKHTKIAAIAENERKAIFFSRGGGSPSYSGLNEWHSEMEQLEVVTTTLTKALKDFGVEKISVLGVDVEGGEHEVFLGFDFSIWQPQIIFCEDHFPSKYNKIPTLLEEKGYKLIGGVGFDKVWTKHA